MTTEIDFYDTTPDEQVRRLAALTEVALPQWGLDGAEVARVAYRENMTFRVDVGDRGVFALRVYQANYRSDAQIQSELDLMTYLNGEGIRTPKVVPTTRGALFTTVESDGIAEPRQVCVFEWIDGKPLRRLGQPIGDDMASLTEAYAEVGRIAARIYNATDRWEKPAGFDRVVWDTDGIYGVNGVIGDFRKLEGVPDGQMRLLLHVAENLTEVLGGFGQSPDRWGLSQGDLLAENIFVCDDGMRMLDFDDSGYSWCMFEIATALADLADTPAFEPCFAAIVSGYREHRDLPEEHLSMLPAFFLARALSYLGWCAKMPHMPQTTVIKPLLLAAVEQQAPTFLAS
jgi:Ser/Thr protein kinase RdoA (MazF antagonist)